MSSGRPSIVPAPLEWHPFYRDKTWLLDWLERRGPYGKLHDIRIPIVRRVRPADIESPTQDATMNVLIMSRHRCVGPAPYVGRPFVYTWNVGVDNLGRCIAGESRIVYTEPTP